ncbi:MAG: M15 family metallopeptidase [Saprospiraceae bacterium]|nr:M15 family metallopeptidase [Saprospiraceae bacterium]
MICGKVWFQKLSQSLSAKRGCLASSLQGWLFPKVVFLGILFLSSCTSEPDTPPEKIDQPKTTTSEEANVAKPDSLFPLEYLLGKFDPTQHRLFATIDAKYSDRDDRLLRREAYDAFKKMHQAAQNEGINFTILSATRNFDYQKGIWERKWFAAEEKDKNQNEFDPMQRALKILEYSSMPGTSRHHWGTDIDLNNFENSYFSQGQGLKEYEWLLKHAEEFGFCQPYTPNRPTGYFEERWHWSFIPLAGEITKQAGERIKENMISGFAGAEQAAQISVVEKYILGINPECLK